MENAIHELSSSITSMDKIEALTPQSVSNMNSSITSMDKVEALTPQSVSNMNTSTARQGVPIITNASLYTNFQSSGYGNKFQQIINLHSMKFYAFLVHKKEKPNRISLIGSNDYQVGDFLVAYSYFHPGYTEPKPIFTAFRSYLDAYHWIKSLSLEHRSAFEIIPPEKQKPHFDAYYFHI